jgi:hypothetical protein
MQIGSTCHRASGRSLRRSGRSDRVLASLLVMLMAAVGSAKTPTGAEVQARVDRDVAQGRPVVVHVVVALCDNVHQGIVPVSGSLGNGQSPRTNLYWGAAFGLRSYLSRRGGYELVAGEWTTPASVLDKVVLHKRVTRGGHKVDVFVVAEAWDGRSIKDAVRRFLRIAAGHDPAGVEVSGISAPLRAGGDAALVAFVGHNGLMDFAAPIRPSARADAPPRSSIVLACASEPFFLGLLREGGSHPLLLTTGLMAPEAYTLDAAVVAFAAKSTPSEVEEAAAVAYDSFQHCGRKAALRLFASQP